MHVHADHHADARTGAAGRLIVALTLTASYLLVEVAAGWWTGSLALLADAAHMLTDVGGLTLSLIAIRLAQRPATPERTYGLYRAEILAALVNGVVLLVMSVFILYEAYGRLLNPRPVASGPMLLVAVVGLAVNIGGVYALRHARVGSLNVHGAYLELLSDAVASVGVIGAAVVMSVTGWFYADTVVSVAIALYIVPRTWHLLREAVEVLLESTPAGIDLAVVRRAIAGIEGVQAVHDLHVWSLTSGVNALSVHVVTSARSDWQSLLDRVHRTVRSTFPIHHTTVQVEPIGWNCQETHL
jgi:cobalt-zinc-cadmium efflux system protein